MASIKFDITGNANGFVAATRQAEAASKGMMSSIAEQGKQLDETFKKIATSAGALFTVQMASQFSSKVAKVRGEFQQLEVAFETMLQSKEKAEALMAQVVDTAAKTPFDLQGVANGAKQLLAYGVASDEVNDTLIRLGDIAAGLSIPLGDLVYLYGTTMTQGRLFTQDLRQFQGRGIPLADELAKQFGVTKDKVGELVTAGKVGFPEVERAIKAMTSEGGKFTNLMAKQSQTITGQISNLEDAIDQMFNNIGKSSEEAISGAIGVASSLVENYEKVGRIVGALVATYGAYKAAVISVAAVEKVHALSRLAAIKGTTLLQVATGALAKQMGILNVVMKANPYVIAATAIVALGSAMWALADHTSSAERAQKRYNEAQEAAAQSEAKRKQEIEKALDIARDANKVEAERVEALLELKDAYPEIFSKYDLEKIKLADILEIKKQIAEEDRKAKSADFESKYAEEAEWLNKNRLTYNKGGKRFRKEYETRQEEQKLRREDYTKTKVSDYISGVGNMDTGYLQKVLAIAQKAQAGNGNFLLEGKNVKSGGMVDLTKLQTLSVEGKNLASVIEAINTELAKRKEVVPTYAEQYANAEKEWQKAKQKLEAIKKDKDKFSEKEYQDAVTQAEEKEKAFKALGGDTSSNGKDHPAIKELKAYEKALQEKRKIQDLEHQDNVSYLETIQNDRERESKLREAENKKEIQELERQKQDYIEALTKAKVEELVAKKQKNINVEGIRAEMAGRDEVKQFDNIIANKTTQQEQQTADIVKSELLAYQEMLSAYDNYYAKKLAIATLYEDKIKNASSEEEKATLRTQMANEQNDIEAKALQQNINFQGIFSGLGGMFKDIVAPALTDAKAYMKTDQFKSSDLQSQQAFIQTVNELEQSMGGVKANFKTLGTAVDNYKKAQQNLTATQKAYKTAYDGLVEAQDEYAAALATGNKAEITAAQTKLDTAKQTEQSTRENLDAQTTAVAEYQQTMTTQAVTLKSAMSGVVSGLQQITSGSLSGVYNGLVTFSESTAKLGGKLADAFGKVAESLKEVPIIGWIVSIIDLFKDGLSIVISGILDAVFNAVSGIIGDILSGDLFISIGKSLVEGIYKVIDSLTFGGALTRWLDGWIYTKDEQQDDLAASNETLGKSLDNLNRNLGKTFSVDAASNLREQNSILEQQRDNYISMINIEQSKKKKKIDHNQIAQWQADIENINRQIEDNIEGAKEKINGITFSSFRDKFLDALLDMEKGVEGLADDIEEDIRKAMYDALLTNDEFKNKLRDLYDRLAVAIENNSESDIARIKSEIQELYNQTAEEGKKIDEMLGYDAETSSDRSASEKGIAQASQSSIDELNGTMTNIQSHTFSINQQMASVVNITSQILARVTSIDASTARLNQIEDSLKYMREDISTITTKGIIMR